MIDVTKPERGRTQKVFVSLVGDHDGDQFLGISSTFERAKKRFDERTFTRLDWFMIVEAPIDAALNYTFRHDMPKNGYRCWTRRGPNIDSPWEEDK